MISTAWAKVVWTPVVRRSAAGLFAAALVTACGGVDASSTGTSSTGTSSAGASSSGDQPTRTVAHSYGTTEVPVDPQRIVATDEYAAMSLLAVGVVPAVVFTGFGSPIADELLEEAGAHIIDVPPVGAPPSEDVLAQSPDLVVVSDYGDDTLYRAIGSVTATVPMPYSAPWKESLSFVADMFDRGSEANRLSAMLDGDIENLRDEVAADPTSLSVLMNSSDILAVAAASAPSSVLAAEVGLTAPVLQTAASKEVASGPYLQLSPELLPSQDADVVAVFDEGVYSAEKVEATAGFEDAIGDHAVTVNGDMWFANHPFATYWLVRDLRSLVTGNAGDVGSESTASARYADFVGALS